MLSAMITRHHTADRATDPLDYPAQERDRPRDLSRDVAYEGVCLAIACACWVAEYRQRRLAIGFCLKAKTQTGTQSVADGFRESAMGQTTANG